MATSIIGLFADEQEFKEAAGKLKSAGFDDISVLSPIPVHGIEEYIGKRPNNVRYFSLAGAITGAIGGFALAAGTALVFVLPTGGRPIIPLPPYLVITYEMTILLGVLFTLFGFHVVSGLPAWRDAPYAPEINVDRFAIVVPAGPERPKAEQLLIEAGAEEVREWEAAS